MLGDHPRDITAAEQFDWTLRQVVAAQEAGLTYAFIGQHYFWQGETRWLQPVPTLARLAAEVDSDFRFATQIMVSPLYDPVMLAEDLATLDIVTGGRLDVGLGLGYVAEEFAAVGAIFEERVLRFEEGVELIRRLWTEDHVDFRGQFYEVSGHTHIRPFQTPHPPIWIGAQSKKAIRRAARLGDAWPITPQVSVEELPDLIEIYAAERRRLGKPVTSQPLRREIVIGRNREDAISKAVEMAKPWYLAMGHSNGVDRDEVLASMPEVVARSFVIGDGAECAEQLRGVERLVDVDPVVTRGNWPGMGLAEMLAYVESLGRELVPALAGS